MAGNDKKVAPKAVNAGPMRGDNAFPVSNKKRPNNDSRGGGGAAGDTLRAPDSEAKSAKGAKPGKAAGKGK